MNASSIRGIVFALYFLSGFSALIYEIVWARMLGLIIGTTITAWATVLTVYMGGMAVGAALGGGIADTTRRPLLLFAICEAGIGLFGVASMAILHAMHGLSVSAIPMALSPLAMQASRIICTAGALCVPTILMGATFPLVCKTVLRESRDIGGSLGRLYSLNTLGACSGATIAGFVLLPAAGVSASLWCAATVNIVVCMAALGFARDNHAEIDATAVVDAQTGQTAPRFFLTVAACTGFCTMAFEILWGRSLVFFLTSTTYAFTAMLGTVVLGLAAGGAIAARVGKNGRIPLQWIAVFLLSIGCFAFASPMAMHYLDAMLQFCETSMTHSWQHWIALRYAVCIGIVFPPSVCLGAVFPLAIAGATASVAKAGRSVGKLTFVNTGGGIIGALCAAFLLVPAFGVQRSFAFVALVACAMGLIVLVKSRQGSRKRAAAFGAMFAVLCLFTVAIAGKNPLVLYSRIVRAAERPTRLVFYTEDPSASVAVLESDRGRTLCIDGFNAAGTYRYEYMRLLGHLPVLLSPSPDTALVICLGTGTTCGAVGLHPSVKRVDCAEICGAVVAASRYFSNVNNAVAANPKVTIVRDDGRNFCARSRRLYDVITLEPMHPYLSAATNLYSYDFYRLCRKRLSPRGIMAQWAPLHVLTGEQYRTLCASFAAAFPHCSLWFLGTEGILVGSMEPLRIDLAALRRRMSDPAVSADCAKMSLADPCRLLSCFVMDERAIGAYVHGATIMTDDRPIIEFAAPRNLAMPSQALWRANAEELLRRRVSVLPLVESAGNADADSIRRFCEASSLVMKSQLYIARKEYALSLPTIDSALALMPGDTTARMIRREAGECVTALCLNRARILRKQGNPAAAEQAYLQALSADSANVAVQTEITTLYNGLGLFDKGLDHARKAVSCAPDDPALLVNLAVVYLNLNRQSDAEPLLCRAAALHDGYKPARYYLDMLHKKRRENPTGVTGN